MKRTNALNRKLLAVTHAADQYVKTQEAIAPAAIAWLAHHGYDTVQSAPAIDRPLVRVVLAHQQAHDTLQRALEGQSTRPALPARRRPS